MSLVGRTWSSTSQFSPTDIPRPILWLDAADSNSFVFTTGSNIFRWLDKSGFSNHADCSFLPAQRGGFPIRQANAINGLPAVTFTNSNSLVGTLMSEVAVMSGFLVMKPQQSSVGRVGQRVFSTANYNIAINSVYITSNINTLEWNRGETYANVPRFDVSADISLGRPFLVSFYGDGGTSVFLRNGSATGVTNSTRSTAASMQMTTYALGNQAFANPSNFTGQIAELILYASPVLSPYRELVEEYLATKWGLGAELPSNNAYAVAGRSIPTRDLTPEDVNDLELWIDAADVSTFDLSGSTSIVRRVRDKSNNRYALGETSTGVTAYTWTRNQFNTSYPSFRTTGVAGTRLASNNLISLSQVTIYFVGQASTFSTNTWLMDGCTGATAADLTISNGAIGTAVATVFNNIQCSNPHVFSYVAGGGAGTMYLNAQAYGGGGTTNRLQGLTLGNAAFGTVPYIGHICEFMIYSGAHGYDKRDRIESYLAQKWGLRSVATGLSTIGLISANAYLNTGVHPYRYVPGPLASPRDLSGDMRLWLDALDPSYSRTNAASVVTQIFDRSPCNWPLTTGGFVRRNFLRGNPAFFDSQTNRNLASSDQFDLSQPFSFYMLFAWPQGGNLSVGLFDACSTANRVRLYSPARLLSAGIEFTHALGGVYAGPTIVSGVANSNAGTSLAFNGIYATGTIGTGRLAGLRVGNTMYGHIAEFLIFRGSHTRTQQQQMEGYLGWRWGVQSVLPSYSWRRQNRVMVPTMAPYQVPGLVLWLDGMDDATLTLSGNSVTRWADKSGLRNDASGGVSPTRSSNGVVFDGTTSFLATPYTADPNAESIFMVVTWTGTTDGSYAVLGTNAASGRSYVVNRTGATRTVRWDNWGLGSYAPDTGFTSNQRFLSVALFSGTRVQSSVNAFAFAGPADVSFSGPGLTNIGAGVSSAYFQGTIHEVVVYSNSLLNFERRRVIGYLAWKWGLEKDLPASHPFRNIKP